MKKLLACSTQGDASLTWIAFFFSYQKSIPEIPFIIYTMYISNSFDLKVHKAPKHK